MDSELLYLLAQTSQQRYPTIKLYRGSISSALTNNSTTALTWDNYLWASNGFTYGSTGATAPLTGYYQVDLRIEATSSATTRAVLANNTYGVASISVSSTQYLLGNRPVSDGTAAHYTVYLASGVVFAPATTLISASVFVNAPSGSTYIYGATGDSSYSYMTITYLSA